MIIYGSKDVSCGGEYRAHDSESNGPVLIMICNGKKQTTTGLKKSQRQAREVVTVNGWYAGGRGGGFIIGKLSVQSMGEVGKGVCPNFH